jgi:transcriptional regulator with XRE-family HTH domain
MDAEGPVAFLGEVARQLREERGKRTTEIAFRLERSEDAVRRFERGEVVPRQVDHVIAVYADVLGVRRRDIWEEAFELWDRRAGGNS